MNEEDDDELKFAKRLSQVIVILFVLIYSLIYVLTFCRIELGNGFVGYGDIIYSTLKKTGMENIGTSSISYGTSSVLITCFLFALIYLLDVINWGKGQKSGSKTILKLFRLIIIVISFLFFFTTCLLISNQILFTPYLAFIVASVGILTLLKLTLFKDVKDPTFIQAIIVGLIISFVSILALWGTSLAQGNVYNFRTQLEYHNRVQCAFGTESFQDLKLKAESDSEFRVPLPECQEAYLIFISPFIFLAGCMIFVGSLIFLNRAKRHQNQHMHEMDRILEPSAQLFFALVLLSIFGLWVAASLSTITKSLASSVITISCIVLATLLSIWFSVFGVDNVVQQLKSTALGKKLIDFLSNDWGKSLLVFTSTPVIILILIGNYMKQFIRRKTKLGKEVSEEDENERNAKFTPSVAKNVKKLTNWELGSILPKVLIWGILYFMFSVGVTRIVVLLLSLLRDRLESVSLLTTSIILILVGLTLFLLPPIPGVPVYITLGVIIPGKATPQFGFIGGIIYAIALSFALKLLALVVQQKLIGEFWGSNNVWVRQTVGINSIEIRATRKILRSPGLTFAKVVILVGGPDWPTSVLTGIMRLNVFQMLLGTLPVIFLIAPTVISGAMVVIGDNDNNIISTLSTVFIFFSAFIQGFALLWAFQVIAATSVKYKEELAQEAPDEQVLQRENENAAKVEEYNNVTKWSNLTKLWKFTNVITAVLMIVSCYGFLILGRYLFVPFEIQDSVADELGGNVLNLVKPSGWICLGMFTISAIYSIVFKQVFKRRKVEAAAAVEEGKEIVTEIP